MTSSRNSVIFVSSALLQKDEGTVLLVQRPKNKSMPGLWEFPGGKIEKGETPEQALVRELKEELSLTVSEQELTPFTFVSHAYETFHLVMFTFQIRRWRGGLSLREGQERFVWAHPVDLGHYPMPEADYPLVKKLQARYKNGQNGGIFSLAV